MFQSLPPEKRKSVTPDRGHEFTKYAEVSEAVKALVENSRHVAHDMLSHVPSRYEGPCLYFKPRFVPAAAKGGVPELYRALEG